MKTTENKLIAEFMGMVVNENDSNLLVFKTKKGNEVVPLDSLNYNTSWDWLMPVVEKIESNGFEFFIVENRCKVAHNTDHSIEVLSELEGETKIEITYRTVIEFITWYNKQKN